MFVFLEVGELGCSVDAGKWDLFGDAVLRVHPLVVQDLLERVTLAWVHDEDSSEEVFRLLVLESVREVEFGFGDSFVRVLKLAGLKGGFANQHEVHDNARTPDINLIGMPRMSHAHTVHDDLGRNIIRGATNRMFPIANELHLRGQPKIRQFQLHLTVDQQIAQFNTNPITKILTPCG